MATIQTIRTGKGKFEWVNIAGEGKPNMNGLMQYVASIVFDPEDPEFKRVEQEIADFWAENKPKGAKMKSNGIYDHQVLLVDDKGEAVLDEDGSKQYENDGLKYLAFKTGTTWPDGKAKVVKTFNAKGKVVHLGDTKIGNGSEGRIEGKMGIYTVMQPGTNKIANAGVTLYLDKVQITKLVEYAGASDDWTGATEDGEGWTGEDFVEESFESDEPQAAAATPRL